MTRAEPPRPIRVVIVDDHPVVRFGLGAIIRLQPDMVVAGEAGTGEEACALCTSGAADVVLMDLRLPGLSGVEAIRAIRKTRPDLRFIVLTTYDGDEDIRRALDAGAQAYLLKAMSHDDVTNTIRRVFSGSRVIPEPVSRRLAERPPHSDLSARELEVLRLIARGQSNREIGGDARDHRGHGEMARQHHPQPSQRQRPHGGHRGRVAARHPPVALSGRAP